MASLLIDLLDVRHVYLHYVLPIVVEVLVEIEIVEMLAQGEHKANEHENAARDAGNHDVVPALV